jgi:hypothetical protein
MQLHLGEDERLPDGVRRELRARCERVARSNLYLSAQLLDLVSRLEEAGVPVTVLKGPAVARTVYDSLTLREFGDLDLLVRSEDVGQAAAEVERLGFVPWLDTAGAQEAAVAHAEYSRPFTRPSDDLDLDLHWDLARTYFRGRTEATELWEHRGTFELHGRALFCLEPEHQLIALCVHGAKHGPFPWPRLKWICDVAEHARGDEARDWSSVLRLGRELGCYRIVLFGLAVARPLMEPGVPGPIHEALEDEPEVCRWADRVWAWLGSEEPVSLSFGERAALDLSLIDGWNARLSYVMRRLVTPTRKDWGRHRLPDGLAFLYVPLRALRLAGQYLPRPWRLRRLFRGKKGTPASRTDR